MLYIAFYDYKIPSSDLDQFTSILFADNKGKYSLIIEAEEINKKYSEYVQILGHVHENIRKTMEIFSSNCFIEDIEIPKALQLPVTFPNPNPDKTFAEHLSSHEPNQVSQEILNEIKSIAASIYEGLNLIKTMTFAKPRKVCKHLKKIYNGLLIIKHKEFIVKEITRKSDFNICNIENLKIQHKSYAKKMRKINSLKGIELMRVQPINLFAKIAAQPIIFEEIYEHIDKKHEKSSSAVISMDLRKNKDKHLIVLVHGFQGNSYDLRLLRSYIYLVYPDCAFLESSSNESKTEGDIREMGSRLSKEVIVYLTENYVEKPPIISFIGHSLGGLIIRAALPYLECLSDRMHLFMTLSSPHLGFMYSSKILDAGM